MAVWEAKVPVLEMGGGGEYFFSHPFLWKVMIQNAFGGLRCFFSPKFFWK